MSDIRSRHQADEAGLCAGHDLDEHVWPCDVIREADRADAEKKRADDADGLYIATASHLRIANARADKAEAALAELEELTNDQISIQHTLEQRHNDMLDQRDAEKERADKAEERYREEREVVITLCENVDEARARADNAKAALREALGWALALLTKANARLPQEVLAGEYGDDMARARTALAVTGPTPLAAVAAEAALKELRDD